MKQRTYYGWVVVEKGDKVLADAVSVEYRDEKDRRQSLPIGRGEHGCVLAVEWWDKRLGRPVKLEPTLRGCYRVYTEGGDV